MATETVKFPMVGKVIGIDVKEGSQVSENDQLAVFESMKMEIPLIAPISGKIASIKVQIGQVVETDQDFCIIEA